MSSTFSDRVVHRLQAVTRLGHAVALVQNGLRAEAMRVAGRAFEMVVGFQAERVGLAVTVEEADHLLHAARNAQDAVGDVGLAAAADLQRRPSLSMIEVPANSTPRIRAWAGLSIGSIELEGDLAVELRGDQLIELDRLAHHRVVEEDDVHRLLEPLQHRAWSGWTASTRRSLVMSKRTGKRDRQVGDRDQDAHDHAQRVQRDLAAALAHQRAELGAQREAAPTREQREAREDQQAWPGHASRAGSRASRPAAASSAMPASRIRPERNERVHVSAATAGSWRSGSGRSALDDQVEDDRPRCERGPG